MSCPVCLETLVSPTSVIVSTPCGHLFHKDCLLPALDSLRTALREAQCPMCRAVVRLHDSCHDFASHRDPQGNPYPGIRRVYIPVSDISGNASLASPRQNVTLRAEVAQARQRVRELEMKESRQLLHSFSYRQEIEAQKQVLESKQREMNRLNLALTEARDRGTKAEAKQKRAEQQVKDANASLAQERAKKIALQRRMNERLWEAEEKAEKAEEQIGNLKKTVAKQRAERIASEKTMLRNMTLPKKSAERQVKNATEPLQEERATGPLSRRKLRGKRQDVDTPPTPPARPSTLVKQRPVSELVP